MAMTNNLINLFQMILMSIGAIFIIIILSLYLSPLLTSAISEVPNLWFSFKSWLSPLYLYFIINGIIITIAATSRHHYDAPQPPPPPPRADNLSSYDAVESDYETTSVKDVEIEEVEKRIVEEVNDDRFLEDDHQIGGEREESTVSETATWIVKQKSLDASPEKQVVSSKSGHHRIRIPAKVNPRGGKLLRVAKPNKHETMENIWKAITEGKQNPSTRQMNKPDTCKNHSRQINLLDDVSPVMKKSETFKDRTNYSPPPVTLTRLKKEPSLSHDELNQRVEAFINKFNENMRLQRQESMQQFMEKINRAA